MILKVNSYFVKSVRSFLILIIWPQFIAKSGRKNQFSFFGSFSPFFVQIQGKMSVFRANCSFLVDKPVKLAVFRPKAAFYCKSSLFSYNNTFFTLDFDGQAWWFIIVCTSSNKFSVFRIPIPFFAFLYPKLDIITIWKLLITQLLRKAF